MALQWVLQPIKLGAVEVPNRVVRTAHSTYSGPVYSEQSIAYHAERAMGGCGLTILQASAVHPSSLLGKALYDDAVLPSMRALVDSCRPHGMRIFQQLWHGGNLYPGRDGPPWTVSDRPGHTGIAGAPMNEDQIGEVIAAFASAASRCRSGGLDGVEVHAAHGYLPHQFLSPHLNTRTDRWGGDFAGRSRFTIEVLRAIRKAAPGFPLGVRLSVSDAPNGISVEDNIALLEAFQAEGLIDFCNISKGDYYRQDTMLSGMHSPAGYELDTSVLVGAAARVPRIVAGRFRTLEEADQAIRAGETDMVAMVRAQIADPALVRKTQEGHPERVRPCIACNQGCLGGSLRGEGLGCTVNPAVGSEVRLSERLISPVTEPKRVLIVGGGPAGLEAARVCATAGHRVVLAEASPNLGGAINVARRAPTLHTIGDIAVWLEQEVYRLGVEVRLSTYLDAADVRTEGADVVIIATGAEPRMDGFQPFSPGESIGGVEQRHVISSTELLAGPVPTARTALVVDSVGHYEALATVEYLLTKGISTTFVTHNRSMSPYAETTWRDIPALDRFYKLARVSPVDREHGAHRPHFEHLTRYRVVRIDPDACIVAPTYAGPDQWRSVPAELVVLIAHAVPSRGLYDELRQTGDARLMLIGDAYAPRDLQRAIGDGHRAARTIG
jgi:2,4-dienoyl-CoA reductase-like NADH-dependent reductase (Old Yellow Enzyme family)